MRPTARSLAMEYVLAAREGKEPANTPAADALGPEDRGLYTELTQGCLREGLFLDAVVQELCRKPPGRKLSALIELSAYQLFFLDRVPAFAVFSEMKNMAQELKFSVQETKFAHGVLKSIERQREEFLKKRADVLAAAETGKAPVGEFSLAVLNASKELMKELGTNAAKSLAAMKQKPRKVGFKVPGRPADGTPQPLADALSARAFSWEGHESPEQVGLAAQAEVSIHVCDVAAKKIRELATSGNTLKVLEMAVGKGSKLLSTLCALGSDFPLEWTAVDANPQQLKVLREDVLPIVLAKFPKVKLTVIQQEWGKPANPELSNGQFNFVWLDAPCTGFGTLAKLPQIALTRGANARKAVKEVSSLQMALVNEGVPLLTPDGVFLYSVCTMTEIETHGVRKHLEALALKKIQEEVFWPGHAPAPESEGFYFALMSRTSAP